MHDLLIECKYLYTYMALLATFIDTIMWRHVMTSQQLISWVEKMWIEDSRKNFCTSNKRYTNNMDSSSYKIQLMHNLQNFVVWESFVYLLLIIIIIISNKFTIRNSLILLNKQQQLKHYRRNNCMYRTWIKRF